MTEVSVVVAAYDEERWIDACLHSLLEQTHPDYELIVVDDGSRDRTAEIAARPGVRLLRMPHRGCGTARDAGARAARGRLLVFLDADELYAEDFLERLVAPLDDPEVAGTFPGGVTWHNPAEGLAPGWLRVRGRPPGERPRFGDRNPWPKAVRREDFERAGGYPRVGYGEDVDFGRRIGPAHVVHAARFRFTLPTGPREVFGKARWIGRGPRFERERPPLRTLLPPWSWRKALRHLRARRPRAACVRVLYDAGLLLGYFESRLLPSRRQRA
ncbi:MAG: glycosyltransferase [Thermoleophilaceae bacterium]|jgi:glycosyltransferase involved in cell wall biosynthesis